MREFLLVLATLAAMVVCGVVALFGTILLLMELGTARHDNYEYYGRYPWLFLVPALIGFLMPALAVWRVHHRRARREQARQTRQQALP